MESLIAVGMHKGEMDFAISGEVPKLSLEQMNQLRQMLVAAIGVLEGMWHHAQAEKPENRASQEKPSGIIVP